jgi:hypothetical protein
VEGFSPSGHTKLDYRAVMGFEERYAIMWFRMVVQRMLSLSRMRHLLFLEDQGTRAQAI